MQIILCSFIFVLRAVAQVYEAADGELVRSLKGHKDTVYCVAFSRDGKRFASGGADKTVIIWTDTLEGILRYRCAPSLPCPLLPLSGACKYANSIILSYLFFFPTCSHNDAIQSLAYNPVTHQLVSCTASDFGIWSAEQKTVNKIKVSSRITTCSWTNDGQYIALGMYNGNVSIRNRVCCSRVVTARRSAGFPDSMHSIVVANAFLSHPAHTAGGRREGADYAAGRCARLVHFVEPLDQRGHGCAVRGRLEPDTQLLHAQWTPGLAGEDIT